jgi:Ca-activated chloride channel family protein
MNKTLKVLAGVAALGIVLTGCSNNDSGSAPGSGLADGPNVLRVLAGSEVSDMAPVLADLKNETGVEIKIDYAGTLEGTQNVANGSMNGKYDATWFPSNRYLALLDGGTAAIAKEQKIMSSPVVLGVKPAVAASLGWDKVSPTWQNILEAVKGGKLTYGMTSPVSSNSGFSALIGAATALSGTGDALTGANVDSVTPALTALFKGQTLTSGSSGWLAQKFAETPTQDAMFNYESVIRSIQVDNKPLTIVTPSDGVITADYPLSLLKSATGEKSALFDKASTYLLSDKVQQKIHDLTQRNTKVSTASATTAFELPFPNKIETAQKLITTYLSSIKKPSHMTFTIDTSGSMGGGRIDQLKAALLTMTDSAGGPNSFIAFQPRETINYVEFSYQVKSDKVFQITDTDREQNLTDIKNYINGLIAEGGTSIYDSLEVSYRNALKAKKADPDSFTSIVLFTDGENNNGKNYNDFVNLYNQMSASNPEIKSIPVFTVRFGEGNPQELSALATMTGGKVFDASKTDLTRIFKEIRGYQ